MTGIIQLRNLPRNSLLYNSSRNPDRTPPQQLPLSVEIEFDEVDNPDYRFEAARLESFRNWPVSFIEPKTLAEAGFYYIGESDRVQCFECQIEVYQWEEGDIPMNDHKRYSPKCRFVNNIPCGNVPIGCDPASVPPSSPHNLDVCGLHDIQNQSESAQECCKLPLEWTTAKLASLGLERARAPVYSDYASYGSRLRTFETWPKSMPQTKELLADAGFFYTGKDDQTLCYHCSGGLKDWEPEDDPWEQHAKWFPKCYYLLMVKGQEYVNAVTGQNVATSSKEQTLGMNLPSFIERVEPTSTEQIHEERNLENNPGSNDGSQDSGIESLSFSGGSSVKGSTDNLSSTEVQKSTEGASSSFSVGSSVKGSTDNLSNTQVHKSIDDARLCKVCYDAELGVVFLPCRHMVTCVKCAPAMTTCAVCREPVTLTLRAIIS